MFKNHENVRLVQAGLVTLGYDLGNFGSQGNGVDGVWGSMTEAAFINYTMPTAIAEYSLRTSVVTRLIQEALKSEYDLGNFGADGNGVDGVWGSVTQKAYFVHLKIHAPATHFPVDDETTLIAFYGSPEQGVPTSKFEPPYPMVIPWEEGDKRVVKTLACHTKVAQSLKSILQTVADFYTLSEIQQHGLDQFFGIKNKRKRRGGTTWSTHAFAIAIDLNAKKNSLGTPTEKAYFPNHCPEIVDIFESYGWTSLGKHWNRDWMHFQAAQMPLD